MIKYALRCGRNHEFEAWFPSSDAYDAQAADGFVACPVCGDCRVRKQIMAPALARGARAPAGGEAAREAASAAGVKPGDGPAAPPAGAASASDADARRAAFLEFASRVREHIAQTHDYVGERFPQEARAMHDGEQEHRPIYGEATAEEARALKEEGAPVAALPAVFAPTPPKKLN